jgi:hypothetical protein
MLCAEAYLEERSEESIMKSLINQIRRLNISNSVIEKSLGLDKVQVNAYNQNPDEYPIMTGMLLWFFKTRRTDKYVRVRLNMVPAHKLPSDTHKSSQSHDHTIKSDNLWSRAKKAVSRIFSRRKV